jgi:tetratricopeptide (TPR) repeat protein
MIAHAVALALILHLTATLVAQQMPVGLDTSESHVTRGVDLMKSNQPEDAANEFRLAGSLAPNSAEPLVWLGFAENQLHHFEESVPALLSALKIDPALETAHYNLALAYAGLGERRKAIAELQIVVKAQPAMTGAQYNLALLLEQEGRAAEAIPHLEEARRQRPSDPDLGLHLIADEIKRDKREQAVEVAWDLFERHKEPQLAGRLGSILVDLGQFDRAISMLEYASNRGANSADVARSLAGAYVGLHQYSKAIQLLKSSAADDPSGEQLYLLGVAYAGDNQLDPAIHTLTMAAERRPQDPAVHFRLGALLLQSENQTNYANGLNELAKAIELAPAETNHYAALGRWLLEHNRVAEAASVLQKGIENAPPSADLYLLLSVAEAVSQSTQLAQPTVEKAIRLNPNIPLAYDVLGFCYFRTGYYLSPAQSYKEASDMNPQSGRFAYDTALALERANEPDQALSYAERAAKADPEQAINHFLLGKLYSKLDRKNDSVRELETAVQLNPSLDYPYYLLARMYMRTGNIARAQELNAKLQEIKRNQMTTHGMGTMSSEPATEPTPSMLLGSGHATTGKTSSER